MRGARIRTRGGSDGTVGPTAMFTPSGLAASSSDPLLVVGQADRKGRECAGALFEADGESIGACAAGPLSRAGLE